jgi:hypothetical protein
VDIKEYHSSRFELRGIIFRNVFIKVRSLGAGSVGYIEVVVKGLRSILVLSFHQCLGISRGLIVYIHTHPYIYSVRKVSEFVL